MATQSPRFLPAEPSEIEDTYPTVHLRVRVM